MSGSSGVCLIEDGELVVLVGCGAPGHSEVGGTGGHPHHVAIDVVIEVDVDDLLAEVVFDEADQAAETAVAGDVDDIRSTRCNLEQLGAVDVTPYTHTEEDDVVGPRIVACLHY